MAYYLSNERNNDVVAAYRRYQEYLRDNAKDFPEGAYALATAEWYQNPSDHRCPHDATLDYFVLSTAVDYDKRSVRTMRTRLIAAYRDAFIEITYPEVFSYSFENRSCAGKQTEWLYDEFRLTSSSHIIHEIEWTSGPGIQERWIIEASDVRFSWHPFSSSSSH